MIRKAIELAVFIAGVALFVTPTGLRLGAKGHVKKDVNSVASMIGPLSKGERRAIRKALHKAGHGGLAIAGTRAHQQQRELLATAA